MSVQPDGDASVAGLQSLEQGDSGEQQQQPAGVQINCIEKIDALFYCSSTLKHHMALSLTVGNRHRAGVGYQLKHYYQYGRPRMCSDKWEDVKMCFRVKTSKPEVGQVRQSTHTWHGMLTLL